jgi:hypothetical protein
MADPVTIGLIAASTMMSMAGKFMEGKSKSDLYKAEGQMAVEKAIAERDAIREHTSSVMAEQRLRYGASGVTMEGSPMAVQQETALQGELQARRSMWTGSVEKMLSRYKAKQTMKAAYWGMGSSLLGGATQSYGSFAKATPSSNNYGGKDYSMTYGLGGTD